MIHYNPFDPNQSRMSGYVKPAETNPKSVPKRLIVCCDGTWQSANHATHEIPSNVAKIARAVSKTYVNEDSLYCPQIVYYDAGVATADIFDSKLSGQCLTIISYLVQNIKLPVSLPR